MYAGRDGIWRTIRDRKPRENMIIKALSTLQRHASVRLFAIVIDKEAASPKDPIALDPRPDLITLPGLTVPRAAFWAMYVSSIPYPARSGLFQGLPDRTRP
jgi:hypothetical protein